MRPIFLFCITVLILRVGVAQADTSETLPSTDQFMNIISACGAGSRFSREGNFQSDAKSIYESQRTQGKSIVDILANIIGLLPDNDRLEAYRLYVNCVRDAILQKKSEKELKGWLQYAEQNAPPSGCDQEQLPADRLLLVVGDTGIWTPPVSLPSKMTAVQIGNCPLLSIGVGENGAVIDADIYATNGEQIGSIRDNGWRIKNSDKLILEKLGDLSGIVVHDDDGNELLYVRYFNNRTFKVRGVFTCPRPYMNVVKVTDTKILILRGMNSYSHSCIGNAGVGFLIR